MSSTPAALILLGLYLLLGGGFAATLRGRGHPLGTQATALVAWPLLLGLLDQSPLAGPYADRIRRAVAELGAALAEPAALGITPAADLPALQASLLQIDARIGVVDRMLADPQVLADPLGQRLAEARGHAAAEVEGVLRGLHQLRLQVGLLALVGDTGPVRDRVADLSARVRALSELRLS